MPCLPTYKERISQYTPAIRACRNDAESLRKKIHMRKKRDLEKTDQDSDFLGVLLGVDFLGVAAAFFAAGAFFVAAAFFAGVFLVALGGAGTVVLVTRPDLVLPSTRCTSCSTAGAGTAALRGRPAFALGFAAAAVVAFFAAAFAGAVLAVEVFLADVLVAAALAFYIRSKHVSDNKIGGEPTVAGAFFGAATFFSALSALGSAFLAAAPAGFASFLASFTVPDAPRTCQYVCGRYVDVWEHLCVVGLRRRGHTLGARELALLLARGDGTVDVALEGGIGHVADLVIGLDIFLDSLTAVDVVSKCARVTRREHVVIMNTDSFG